MISLWKLNQHKQVWSNHKYKPNPTKLFRDNLVVNVPEVNITDVVTEKNKLRWQFHKEKQKQIARVKMTFTKVIMNTIEVAVDLIKVIEEDPNIM